MAKINPILQQAINSFPYRNNCRNPYFCFGDCDSISQEFLKHAQTCGIQGIILAVDNPTKKPTEGWKPWGGYWKKTGSAISHYIAYFPELKIAVDWTARQFWHDCQVPIVQNKIEVKQSWDSLPFGWKDARLMEDNVAGSLIESK